MACWYNDEKCVEMVMCENVSDQYISTDIHLRNIYVLSPDTIAY